MQAGIRTWRAAPLAAALVLGMAGFASNQPDGSREEASVVWALDGDGEPTVGDIALTYSGAFDLSDDAVAFDGCPALAAPPRPVR